MFDDTKLKQLEAERKQTMDKMHDVTGQITRLREEKEAKIKEIEHYYTTQINRLMLKTKEYESHIPELERKINFREAELKKEFEAEQKAKEEEMERLRHKP